MTPTPLLPVYETVREASCTRYRVVLTRLAGEVVIALPDLRWCYAVWWGQPPAPGYLADKGLDRISARDVAAILAEIWPRVAR